MRSRATALQPAIALVEEQMSTVALTPSISAGDAVVIARPARNGVHGYLRDVRSCRGERGGDVDAARKGYDRLLGAAGKDSRLFGIG